MAPVDGPERRLRSWALTLGLVALVCWMAAHVIVAIAPVLIMIGAVVAVGYISWVIVQRRRW